MPNYHHAVIEKATPSVEFTKRCYATDNAGMSNPTAAIRRKNLQRLIDRDFGGNQSEIARVYNPENPKPQYFSDLLRPGSTKPFGEKAARNIEEKTGLLHGQLDIPDSPLTSDESKRSRLKDELRLAVDDLDREEQHEALLLLRKLRSRRNLQRKAG